MHFETTHGSLIAAIHNSKSSVTQNNLFVADVESNANQTVLRHALVMSPSTQEEERTGEGTSDIPLLQKGHTSILLAFHWPELVTWPWLGCQ